MVIKVINLLIIILIFNTSKVFAQKHLFSIDFQESFKQDTVSLKINNIQFFENYKLTSNRVLGLSLASKVLLTKEKNILFEYSSFSESNVSEFKELKIDDFFEITVLYQNNIFSKFFDVNKGKYIGVQKNKCNTIEFVQSKSRFIYE